MTQCSKNSIIVEAVHRSTQAGDTRWVALRVPKRRYPDVGEYLAREWQFLLVAANPTPLSEQAAQYERDDFPALRPEHPAKAYNA